MYCNVLDLRLSPGSVFSSLLLLVLLLSAFDQRSSVQMRLAHGCMKSQHIPGDPNSPAQALFICIL